LVKNNKGDNEMMLKWKQVSAKELEKMVKQHDIIKVFVEFNQYHTDFIQVGKNVILNSISEEWETAKHRTSKGVYKVLVHKDALYINSNEGIEKW
jgi:hypothetical protein